VTAVTAPRRIMIEPYSEHWPSEFATASQPSARGLGSRGNAHRPHWFNFGAWPRGQRCYRHPGSVADLDDHDWCPLSSTWVPRRRDMTADHVPPGDQSPASAWRSGTSVPRPCGGLPPTRASGRSVQLSLRPLVFRELPSPFHIGRRCLCPGQGGACTFAPGRRGGLLRREEPGVRPDHGRSRALGDRCGFGRRNR